MLAPWDEGNLETLLGGSRPRDVPPAGAAARTRKALAAADATDRGILALRAQAAAPYLAALTRIPSQRGDPSCLRAEGFFVGRAT